MLHQGTVGAVCKVKGGWLTALRSYLHFSATLVLVSQEEFCYDDVLLSLALSISICLGQAGGKTKCKVINNPFSKLFVRRQIAGTFELVITLRYAVNIPNTEIFTQIFRKLNINSPGSQMQFKVIKAE